MSVVGALFMDTRHYVGCLANEMGSMALCGCFRRDRQRIAELERALTALLNATPDKCHLEAWTNASRLAEKAGGQA